MPDAVERIVDCPACKGRSLYSPRNPYRPFCSARCKGLDLGAWATESFRLPDEEGDPLSEPQAWPPQGPGSHGGVGHA